MRGPVTLWTLPLQPPIFPRLFFEENKLAKGLDSFLCYFLNRISLKFLTGMMIILVHSLISYMDVLSPEGLFFSILI